MNLTLEEEHDALLAAENTPDDVPREAQWLCLRCEAIFPGIELFRDGPRQHACLECGSGRMVIPENIEGEPE